MTEPTLNRRTLLGAAAAASTGALLPVAARGAIPARDMAAIRRAVVAGKDASVTRLQEWIRHPGIAAEKWRMDESCDFTMGLLSDAGFQMVRKMPTDGSPGIFATLDAGAQRSVGIYFMYDVKQVNPAEWDNPPYEAAIIDKPGFGRCVTGRGSVNQKGPEATFLAALHAFKAMGKKLRKVIRSRNEQAKSSLRKMGVTIVTTPQATIDAWQAAAETTWKALVGKLYTQDELDKVIKYRDEYRAKHPVK